MRTIAHISDIHFGRINPAVLDPLVRDLHELRPSLTVISGDLTQRARPSQFRDAANFLARLPTPRLVIPGNHDVPLWNFVYRMFAPLKHYREFITPDLSPVFEDDEMIVVGINTARRGSLRLRGFWKDGAISDDQIASSMKLFFAAAKTKHRIVVTHHPLAAPLPILCGDVVGNAPAALRSFASVGVELLLSGHLHLGFCDAIVRGSMDEGRMLTIQAGSATSTRIREATNSYNLITLAPDRIILDMRRWDGSKFVPGDMREFPRYSARSQSGAT